MRKRLRDRMNERRQAIALSHLKKQTAEKREGENLLVEQKPDVSNNEEVTTEVIIEEKPKAKKKKKKRKSTAKKIIDKITGGE